MKATELPKGIGTVVDLAPIEASTRSQWLLLAEDGSLVRFDADTAAFARVGVCTVPAEPGHEPWCDHALRRHLHVSPCGSFAAVVNDYGRYGSVVDLERGASTLALDGGDYYPETVAFSLAFAVTRGRTVVIHRSAWNRLDVSDPATGALLTGRGPTHHTQGQERPEHDLDYFHGALFVSPDHARIVSDGWVWHPVGMPAVWNLDHWCDSNVWESEDGPTRQYVCAREYYWGHAACWIDNERLAIGGLGDDDSDMIDGARVFDITQTGMPTSSNVRTDWRWPRELIAFPGPAGSFFSDGISLFSSDASGLSRWDVAQGVRIEHVDGFRPTHHHRAAGELAAAEGGCLVRWPIR